jgi:hypothetical protein
MTTPRSKIGVDLEEMRLDEELIGVAPLQAKPIDIEALIG